MKKKTLLAAAIALATASAMTFAPVSYKVIDKAHAAETSVEKATAIQTLKDVFVKLNVEENHALATAYSALLAQLDADVSGLDFATDLPKLDEALAAHSADIQASLIAFVKQVIADYGVESSNLSSTSDEFKAALADLNDKLIAAELTDSDNVITTNDAAELLLAIEASLLDVDSLDITNTDLAGAVIDIVANYAEAQWSAPQNKIVSVLKAAYGDIADLKSDFTTLKANFNANADASKKAVYKKGIVALGIAYAQSYLEKNPPLENSYNGRENPLNPNLLGINAFPLSALNWTTDNDAAHTIGENLDETGILTLRVGGYGSINVTVNATLKQGVNIPAEFVGVKLFSQNITVHVASPIDVETPAPVAPGLSLINDYKAKADAISGKVADYLKETPSLSNNTAVYGLKKTIEESLREALTVNAANATTVVNGVTTLNVTPEQLAAIYQGQLKTVLDAAKAALEAAGIKLDLAPTLTFNVGVTANAQVNLSKEAIASLASNGIANVGVRSGDAVIESAVSQLSTASSFKIKKSAADNVQAAKSDIYSLSVTDANGKEVLGYKQQYRVTLPVNGDGSNVTVAMLGNGSQTLVGGKYDPATKTITFYTNVLGDFAVVENTTEFDDTANLDWANDAIELLANKGIIQGKGNGKFDPQSNVTRAEFTAMIVRALNLSVDANLTFEDVKEGAWYHDAVAAAFQYGIISGRSAEQFDPNASITREEMATVTANALKSILGYEAPSNVDEILNKFNDGDKVVSVHRENVALLANDGVVQGKGNDNYDPKGNALRAEVAVIIASIFEAR